jgi:predicted PurR-regulated permease PerM
MVPGKDGLPVSESTPSASAYRPFFFFLTLALVTVALYWAQRVLIPVALAVLLAFVLTPVVTWLQRQRLPRSVAVAVTVLLAFAILLVVGLTITWQVQTFVTQLPGYRDNIVNKVNTLRNAARGTFLENLQNFVQEINQELRPSVPPALAEMQPLSAVGASTAGLLASPSGQSPLLAATALYPGRIYLLPTARQPAPSGSGLGQLEAILGPVVERLADAVLAIVLVIFILMSREDLRNRVVRLLGPGQVVSTTRALDDSARRLSRYLLMQSCTNAVVGAALAVGLWLLGVPYFLLWGFLAFALRFVPYAGTWSVAALLALFCVAISPGWTQPLLAFGYFAVVEIVMSQVIEPLLFGHTTGISPVALVIAIAFWTWLWGPVGLMLSIPLTTCLAVLGKYLPQLEFFDVLLGDKPVLDEKTRYYQRLLARDQDEATELVEDYLGKHEPMTVGDDLLLPALVQAKRDHERGELPLEDLQFAFEVTRALLDDLAARQEDVEAAPAARGRALVLGCPARDQADELALEMVRLLLAPAGYRVEGLSSQTMSAEVVERVGREKPAVVCIAAVPPGGLAQALYLTKRLRRQFPELKIAVGLWGQEALAPHVVERLQRAGADQVATTLQESRNQMVPLLQVAAAAAAADDRELVAGTR